MTLNGSGGSQMLGFGPKGPPPLEPPGQAESEANRRQNQIDAFRQVMEHDPVTANDWKVAAALDPHSYDAKNGGVPPNIVVSRIEPMPGQGLVRTNLFIPGEEAWYPDLDGGISGHNLGDNRGFSPIAGPEDSRVTMFVDYDNGVIVTRQNPSVDTGGGGVKVGSPSVSAAQRPDGSVYVRYEAVDPLSPGGETLGKLSHWSVNGNIAIEPTAEGPRVGGSITSFPAVEIYRDAPNGVTTVLSQVMPLNVGQEGPLVGLPLHQSIGDGHLLDSFNHVEIIPRGTIVVGPDLTDLGTPANPSTIPITK